MYFNISFILFYMSMMTLLMGIYAFFFGTLIIEFIVMNFGMNDLIFILYFDWMSLIFTSVVMFISSMIYIYSDYYMESSEESKKFIFLLLMFIFSMCLVILSPSIFSLLFGWDGLGFFSYCLVIFYPSVKSSLSGMVTVLSNRVGDVMLILSVIIGFNYGLWGMFYLSNFMATGMILLIFFAGITKSAQIPFSAWLPAAMAAPTPVSALVHSSTLVTAGAYMFIRLGLNLSYTAHFLILIISLFTTFMAGFSALYEMDFKKIIALSTLSQLGLMVIILSVGSFIFAYYHLIIHALFKSLLFMSAGVVIHGMMGDQDLRNLSSVLSSSPYLGFIFLSSNFSLMGIPFMGGFYSKDMLIEEFLSTGINMFFLIILILALVLTTLYSMRLVFFVLGFSTKKVYFSENKLVNVSFLGLMILSVTGGCLFGWKFLKGGDSLMFWEEKIFISFISLLSLSLALYFYENLIFGKMKLVSFFGSLWGLHVVSNFYMTSKFFSGVEIEAEKDYFWSEYLESQGLYSSYIQLSLEAGSSVTQFQVFAYFMLFVILIFVLFLVSLM